MSKKFLTKQQVLNLLNTSSEEKEYVEVTIAENLNEFASKKWLVTQNKFDETKLTGYNDNDYVIEDDIVVKQQTINPDPSILYLDIVTNAIGMSSEDDIANLPKYYLIGPKLGSQPNKLITKYIESSYGEDEQLDENYFDEIIDNKAHNKIYSNDSYIELSDNDELEIKSCRNLNFYIYVKFPNGTYKYIWLSNFKDYWGKVIEISEPISKTTSDLYTTVNINFENNTNYEITLFGKSDELETKNNIIPIVGKEFLVSANNSLSISYKAFVTNIVSFDILTPGLFKNNTINNKYTVLSMYNNKKVMEFKIVEPKGIDLINIEINE